MDRQLYQLITARTHYSHFFKKDHWRVQILVKHQGLNPLEDIVNSINFENIFAKSSIVDVGRGFKYAPEYVQDIFEKNKQISF